jgi:hypothetical protein
MSTKATAARIYEYGEPDVFRFETMDVPDPVVSGRVSELEQRRSSRNAAAKSLAG